MNKFKYYIRYFLDLFKKPKLKIGRFYKTRDGIVCQHLPTVFCENKNIAFMDENGRLFFTGINGRMYPCWPHPNNRDIVTTISGKRINP